MSVLKDCVTQTKVPSLKNYRKKKYLGCGYKSTNSAFFVNTLCTQTSVPAEGYVSQ